MNARSLRRLAAASVITSALSVGAGPALAAGTHLFGASVLNISKTHDPRVTYRATGLRAANAYALRLVRPRMATHPRCVAYLSAPRPASGTEHFYGSVPSALNCVAANGVAHQIPMARGTYEVEVCVPATPFGACRSTATVVRRTVRLI
ncbi:MAG: hypothetical protein QOH12_1894 [Solirubrobacteraceae bacterium]|jgi:hypothetical protein|nr:hypothetical protein [Solirubrobacteraceae bacterium]